MEFSLAQSLLALLLVLLLGQRFSRNSQDADSLALRYALLGFF
jgi:hypothetical protein